MSTGSGVVQTVNTASPQMKEMLCAREWSGRLENGWAFSRSKERESLVATCTAAITEGVCVSPAGVCSGKRSAWLWAAVKQQARGFHHAGKGICGQL